MFEKDLEKDLDELERLCRRETQSEYGKRSKASALNRQTSTVLLELLCYPECKDTASTADVQRALALLKKAEKSVDKTQQPIKQSIQRKRTAILRKFAQRFNCD